MSVTPEDPTITSASPSASNGYETATFVSRETESPISCWFMCNYCYKVAQIIGTVPSLCFSESLFKECFNECAECAVSAVEVPKPSLSEVFEVFKPYTDYCAGPGIISSYPQSLLTTAVRTQIFALTGFGRTEPGYPEIVIATITEMRPGVFTPQATSQPTSQPVESTASGLSSAGVVGAIVGGTSFMLLFAAGMWSLRRRRKRKVTPSDAVDDKRGFEKPQLHSDCIPRLPAIELEGSYPEVIPEIGANEIAAQEMLGSEEISTVEMPSRSA